MQVTTEQAAHAKRRTTILWAVIAVVMFATVVWRYTGLPFPQLELRIFIVVLGTIAIVANLWKGIMLGFSRMAGWRQAAQPLLWAAAMLFLVGASLLGDKANKTGAVVLSGLGALCVLVAGVVAQREREKSLD